MDLLALHQAQPQRYPFLLESVAGDEATTARYSLLLAFPEDSLVLDSTGLQRNKQVVEGSSDFLDEFDVWYRQLSRDSSPTDELPYNGGWFVYLGYELAGQVETSLRLPGSEDNFPTALAVRCPAAVIQDHQQDNIHFLVEPDHPEQQAMHRQMQADAAAFTSQEAPLGIKITQCIEEPDQAFINSVLRIQEYIRAGDVFQVNLSRQWRLECEAKVDQTALYASLRESNPAPFSGLFSWEGQSVVSSSPERLISVRGSELQTRPIAGTRPRQITEASDAAMRKELLLHPKERAEHIMLIDLERNDLGRVCEAGSIEVNELLGVESYEHVHHIVSNVRGKLREQCSPVDAIRAVFPGGTITGCPKVRCMEIIAELEQAQRGPYTGAMGYLDRNGNLDLNILIRSLQVQGKQIHFRAGAGIVADSIPQAELDETRAKARGLLRAMGLET